jgi:RNA 2',3'-cyclic 3'-phosphodiesterase
MAGMHRLFFAIFPDHAALAAIGHVVERLRDANVVRGRWLAPEKYHLTIRFLGDHDDVSAAGVVARARAAAAKVRAPAFPIALDRVATFRGRFRAPCVLRCARGCDPAVRDVRDRLDRQLAGVGIDAGEEQRFQPHLTIAYTDRALDAAIDVEPIGWQVADFALVDSHRSRHAVLERWPMDR